MSDAKRIPRDVQTLLTAASEQLKVGELLHGDDFSLAAVMSAAEIGDPRLDAGMAQNQQEGSNVETEAPTDLSGPQIIAVMDQMAVMEASWQAGHSLAQTVYTCHYLLHQERISHLTSLSSFCTGVKVSSQVTSDLVRDSGACAEEDFLTYMFGFQDSDGLEDVPKAVAIIVGAEEQLSAVHRGFRLGGREAGVAAALLCRLRFRRNLLSALLRLSRNTKQDMGAARKLLTTAQEDLREMQATSGLTRGSAPGFLPKINSHRMGNAPPRPVSLLSLDETWAAFSALLQQLLFVCNIAKVASWWELEVFLEGFCTSAFGPIPRSALAHCLASTSLKDSPLPWTPDPVMMAGALGVRRPEHVTATAVAVFFENSSTWAKCWVRVMCHNRARQRRRHRRSVEDWSHLLNHALNAEDSPGFSAWLAEVGWRWEPSEGSRLQPQGPLSTWVELQCCQEMLQHLLLGFELDCYLPHEFCMLFWYCDYLYGILVENANYLATTFPFALVPAKASKGKAGKKQAKPSGAKGHYVEAIILLQKAKIGVMEKQMCQGLMRATAALRLTGALAPRPTPFNTDEQYFEQRFFFLTTLSAPAALTYPDYAAAMDLSGCTAVELMRNAAMNFHEVRKHAATVIDGSRPAPQQTQSSMEQAVLEKVAEVAKVLEKVAKHNIVALAILTQEEAQKAEAAATRRKSHAEPEEEVPKDTCDSKRLQPSQEQKAWEISWDFSHHKFFPVISLKKASMQ